MPKKELLPIKIKNIPLEVETEGLGVVEITDLAGRVESYMDQLNEVDTLKQALMTALHFAAQSYNQNLHEGGKRQEEISRVNDLIIKLQQTLAEPK